MAEKILKLDEGKYTDTISFNTQDASFSFWQSYRNSSDADAQLLICPHCEKSFDITALLKALYQINKREQEKT